MRIGEARGVALASAAAAGAEVFELTPAEAKRAMVGNGQASKEQVAAMVRTLFVGVGDDLPLDATDAVALAYAQAKRLELQRAMGEPLAGSRGAASNGGCDG